LDLNWLVDMCAAFWDSYITIPADSAAFAAIVGQCRYEPSPLVTSMISPPYRADRSFVLFWFCFLAVVLLAKASSEVLEFCLQFS